MPLLLRSCLKSIIYIDSYEKLFQNVFGGACRDSDSGHAGLCLGTVQKKRLRQLRQFFTLFIPRQCVLIPLLGLGVKVIFQIFIFFEIIFFRTPAEAVCDGVRPAEVFRPLVVL